MSKDLLRDSWASLGIAFNAKSNENSDPESALILFLQSGEFPEDRKMISLILIWLKEYSHLIHIERLKVFLKDLSAFELAILGGIASKCIKFGDFRWKTIINYVKKRNTGRVSFEVNESEYLIVRNGVDEDFLEFGLKISRVEPERINKILSIENIIERNSWIRYRFLFGVNMRADIATVMVLKLAITAYQASKVLQCSFNAASRNWNDLVIINFKG